jgi:hypothetical protein
VPFNVIIKGWPRRSNAFGDWTFIQPSLTQYSSTFTLFAIQPNADGVLEDLFRMVRATRIARKTIWQGWF